MDQIKPVRQVILGFAMHKNLYPLFNSRCFHNETLWEEVLSGSSASGDAEMNLASILNLLQSLALVLLALVDIHICAPFSASFQLSLFERRSAIHHPGLGFKERLKKNILKDNLNIVTSLHVSFNCCLVYFKSMMQQK